jgi:BirA family transcriptional regulator, biotin operon repressor / biotin---[acetyl-CoA-carboxylase] ligase
MRLDPAAVAAGFRLSAHDTLPSTNTEALALARRGETEPFWVTARQQTAGRGRRGNAWISVPGNFYATLLLCDPAAPENAPQLSFVAALAVFDAIVERAAALREKLTLKWPNDVLCEAKKLAGILVEGESIGAKLAVAIGIGVNCMHHPVDTAYPATDLAAAGAAVSAEDLFFGAMARRLAQWHRGAGFQSIRTDWLDRAMGIGGEMRVRLPNREFVGRAEALDERGQLLLRLADGTLQTITAGDVFPVAASG